MALGCVLSVLPTKSVVTVTPLSAARAALFDVKGEVVACRSLSQTLNDPDPNNNEDHH